MRIFAHCPHLRPRRKGRPMYKNKSQENNLNGRHHLCAARRCRHQFANPAANPIVNPYVNCVNPAKTYPRKHLISRKFPVFPKNAPQNFNTPPHSTFPSQVLEMPNSAPLSTPVRKAHKFLSIPAYSQPSTPLSKNTLSLQKNTLPNDCRSLIDAARRGNFQPNSLKNPRNFLNFLKFPLSTFPGNPPLCVLCILCDHDRALYSP